jgi:DNA-binding NarL/FixJ family response regulator
MRILCVDDHAVVREGIALIIDLQGDMEVVGSAATGEEGVELFRRLRPDVTLMDLELPGMSGIDAIRAIRAEHADARIIVLTMHHDAENIYRALQAGATTYWLKDTISKALIRVLREVYAGGRPLPDEIAAVLAQRSATLELTPREVQVVELIANGFANKKIAATLGISDDTVHAHLKNIFRKLGVTDRTAAVTTAVKRGIVKLK